MKFFRCSQHQYKECSSNGNHSILDSQYKCGLFNIQAGQVSRAGRWQLIFNIICHCFCLCPCLCLCLFNMQVAQVNDSSITIFCQCVCTGKAEHRCYSVPFSCQHWSSWYLRPAPLTNLVAIDQPESIFRNSRRMRRQNLRILHLLLIYTQLLQMQCKTFSALYIESSNLKDLFDFWFW